VSKLVETIPLEKPIYCSWVEMEVEKSLLGRMCDEHIHDGRCDKCPRSLQLDYGVAVDKLLENLRTCS
jgi:hypothetical protein